MTRTYRQLGVPSILATPEIEVILIEDPEPSGPFGAKGISEVATVPVTPAILNAIFDATGVRVTKLPADPAQIRAGMLSTSPHWWRRRGEAEPGRVRPPQPPLPPARAPPSPSWTQCREPGPRTSRPSAGRVPAGRRSTGR